MLTPQLNSVFVDCDGTKDFAKMYEVFVLGIMYIVSDMLWQESLFICVLASATVLVAHGHMSLRTAIILNSQSSQRYDYHIVKPALDLAFRRSFDKYNIQFQQRLYLYEPECNEALALRTSFQAVTNQSVDLVIGPSCTEDLVSVSKLLLSYQIFMLTGGASLTDSTVLFTYTIRTAFSVYTQWLFFLKMCENNNWTTVSVVVGKETTGIKLMGQSLVKHLRNKRFRPIDIPFNGADLFTLKTADGLLQQAKSQSRIIVLLMSPVQLRQTIIQAQRAGMCNGEYAFFAVDFFQTDIVTSGWQKNDVYDQEAATAYRALFAITLRYNKNNPQSLAFEKQVRDFAKQQDLGPVPDVNYYSGSYHDAILMYAAIINETLEEGNTIGPENVELINKKFANRTFSGSTGTVYMNADGDRSDDYQLWQIQDTDDTHAKYVIVAEFFGYKGLYEEVRPIKWLTAGNSPPRNNPRCGYDGQDIVCLNEAKTALAIALGTTVAIVIFGGISGVLIYRTVRIRSALFNNDWLASWEEIYIHQITSASRTSRASELSLAAHATGKNHIVVAPALRLAGFQHKSTASLVTAKQSYKSAVNESAIKSSTTIATFRNVITMVRLCLVPHVDLSTTVRNQVRIVKAMNNENLLKFVGACIEPTHIVVLNEYCSRGTLQDVLQNDFVMLDWVFRLSFSSEIVRGLIFLHSSELQCHGRLTSKCCFMDKRFVLKIGDYGLSSFYDNQETAEAGDLLWTAPELLRTKQNRAPTPEADAYSFAIILQEIVSRESPYFQNTTNTEEIIRRVECGERPPFRPIVEDPFCYTEILFVMRSCWAENPSERLKFPQVRSCLRQLSKTNGYEKSSIIDALLERMELHAQNLETSVEEKTQALVEEKKKTDQLLYSILPKEIAEQLKRGEQVLPESYENVTIYFGDIVEFTSLSSASTPIEIVNLMNDLYCQFDLLIATFDAYKVETIGDCYVIVSGLPNRNGQKHALEIARLALALRSSIQQFKVRHRPGMLLQLRVGLNSGPCVAGVVGFATPRYCLFGDTVNVASRMESTGEAMKIQISSATHALLQNFAYFQMDYRGDIQIKGKGSMDTYWLIEENS